VEAVKTVDRKSLDAHLVMLYKELHKAVALSTSPRLRLGDDGRWIHETVFIAGYSEAIKSISDQIKYGESQIAKCHEG